MSETDARISKSELADKDEKEEKKEKEKKRKERVLCFLVD
jgi:hypothetical protein